MIDEKAALIAERTTFYEMLTDLADDDWDAASLCEGWRVRDVAAHAHLGVTMSIPAALKGMARARGDFDRFMNTHVPSEGSKPTAEIVATWSEVARSSKIPPTIKRVAQAIDVFVHHHDIALPLGRSVPSDPDRLRWMADGLVGTGTPIGSAARVDGLRLIATDIDWHYGTGPEVTGPAAAIILAGCGRRALDDELAGDGLAQLRQRG